IPRPGPLWLSYAAAGPLGLILLKCSLGLATMYVLACCLRLSATAARDWGPLLALVAASLGRWLIFRPQLFTYLLFATFVLVLFRRLLGKRTSLWVLPLLLAVWVNLHGGFLAGLGAIGLAGLLRAGKSMAEHGFHPRQLLADVAPLALTFLGCFVASLLNPLG